MIGWRVGGTGRVVPILDIRVVAVVQASFPAQLLHETTMESAVLPQVAVGHHQRVEVGMVAVHGHRMAEVNAHTVGSLLDDREVAPFHSRRWRQARSARRVAGRQRVQPLQELVRVGLAVPSSDAQNQSATGVVGPVEAPHVLEGDAGQPLNGSGRRMAVRMIVEDDLLNHLESQ